MSATSGSTETAVDVSTLSLEDQMELGAKMFLSPQQVTNFAPFIMGFWFDTIMLGAAFVLYARWSKHASATERTPVKVLAHYVMFVSFALSCYFLAYIMYLFVSGFGAYIGFLNANWTRVFYTTNMLTRVPAAAFFAHRAWKMHGRSWWIIVIQGLLLGVTVGFSIATTVRSDVIPATKETLRLILVTLSAELAADFINTTLLFIGLVKSRTGWSGTDKLVTKLLWILVETQFPPTFCSFAYLITVIFWQWSSAQTIFIAMPKVHVICLLVVLCSRINLRASMKSDANTDNSYRNASYTSSTKVPTVTVETVSTALQTLPNNNRASQHAVPDTRGILRSVNGRAINPDENEKEWHANSASTSQEYLSREV